MTSLRNWWFRRKHYGATRHNWMLLGSFGRDSVWWQCRYCKTYREGASIHAR